MKNYLIILSLLVSVLLSSAHADTSQKFDQRPVVISQPQPAYPYEMEKAGITGDVVVQFIIDKKGNVKDVRIVRSSHKGFEEAAARAVYKWKFKPGMKNGKPVELMVSQLIPFDLEQLEEPSRLDVLQRSDARARAK